jgi:Tfp pilus assembly protein PilF
MLGAVLVRMGEHAAAAEALERELAQNPNDFESHLLLAVIRRQEYDHARARSHLERAIALRPGDPGVGYQLALVEIGAGELEAARARLEALVAEHPKWSEAHVSLATVYYRLRRKADGDRHQAIVRELAREKEARESAAREQPAPAPAPPPP